MLTGKIRAFLLMLCLLLCVPMSANAQDSGSSWLMTFFGTQDLSGGVLGSTTRPTLNLDFAADRTILPPGVDINNFSLRAQTQRTFQPGRYEFRVGSDDGVRLYIDGDLIIDSFVTRSYQPSQDTAEVALGGGIKTISVEYFNTGATARLDVSWIKLADAVSAAAAPPVPLIQVTTGQVRNVEGLSVRSGPYLGASRIEIIEPGAFFPVFARNTQEGQFTWYLIEAREIITVDNDVEGGQIVAPVGDPVIGWVSGRYFRLEAPEETVPLATSVFETLVSPPSTGVQGVTRSNLRLRQLPSYRTPTLTILDWGADFEILSRTTQDFDNYWYQVNYEGQIGWVFAPFVAVIGEIDLVPEY